MQKISKKNDSSDEKTENSSELSLENGAINGVRSEEKIEKSAKGVVVITITTCEYSTADVTMGILTVVAVTVQDK